MSYPKTSLLEEKLFSYLSNHAEVKAIAQMSASHPLLATDLASNKGRIVMEEINNLGIGKFLTRDISAPGIQFACYSANRFGCRKIQEVVINALEKWTQGDFVMVEQKLQFAELENAIAPRFSQSSSLFTAAVVYRFHIARI